MIRVIPDKPEETQALWEACAVLSSEDPLDTARYILAARSALEREIY